MRVCLSPGTLGDGGIGMHALHLARAFVNRGVATDLFLTAAAGPRTERIPEGVHVYEGGGHARSSFSKFARYLRAHRPDLVLSSRHHVHVLTLLARNAAGGSAKVACIYHTYDSIALGQKSFPGRVYAAVANRFVRWADVLVAVSNGVARDVEHRLHLSEGSVRTIYNPAWDDHLASQVGREVDHPWLAATRDHRTIIGVGRLTQQKDFPTLLRAFERVRTEADVKLVILGEGEDRAALGQLAKDLGVAGHVSMPGHVSNPVAHIARADLFVLSSGWEGFGNVIVEALGAGTSVVSTDCRSGPSEILAGGRYGRLVPVGDHSALANAMMNELLQPRDREMLQTRAREFSASRIVDQYLALAR